MRTSVWLLLACVVAAIAATTLAHPYDPCDHHRWSQIEAEDPVDQAATEKFPATLVSFGWRQHHSGRCSYKRDFAPCPHRDDWHHDSNFWDILFPRAQPIGHPCTTNSTCCSNYCNAGACAYLHTLG